MPSIRVKAKRRRLRREWREWLINAGALFGVFLRPSPLHAQFVFTKPFYEHLLRVIKGDMRPDKILCFKYSGGPTYSNLSLFEPPEIQFYPCIHEREDSKVWSNYFESIIWRAHACGLGARTRGVEIMVSCLIYIKEPRTLANCPDAVRMAHGRLQDRLIKAEQVLHCSTAKSYQNEKRTRKFTCPPILANSGFCL